MRRNPVPRAQHPLRQDAVLRPKIELLRRGDGDVVQAVQEGERLQRGVCLRDGGQRLVRDAVRGVDNALCGVRVEEGGVFFAEDGEGGAFFQGGGGRGVRVRGEGDEERRVVVEGVAGGGQARYAEPGGEGRQRVRAPVGVVRGEGGRCDDGAEVRPAGDELGGLLVAVLVTGLGVVKGKRGRGAHLSRKDRHVGMDLQQRFLMAVIRKLVADSHSIDQRLLLIPNLLPASSQSPRQHLNLARELIDLGNSPHRTLRRMPLLGKPARDIALPTLQPRIDQHIVVEAGAALDG